ncbi:MAG: amidophosphoribosyltransferase, partial [Rikenellaceae bacterium]
MEQLKHECGVVLIRLKKPLEYYKEKYGTSKYGLNKLYLLMEKQHNRGQEGAGMACVKLTSCAGEEFMFRERKEGKSAITDMFSDIHKQIAEEKDPAAIPFLGECYMGHLRYSTTGRSGISYVHPVLRRQNYRHNTFALCGNFNLTNVGEIFESLKATGQHPRRTSDTTVLLEQIGYELDKEPVGGKRLENILSRTAPMWD